MRLKRFKKTRKGDHVTFEAEWLNKWKKPGQVTIAFNTKEDPRVDTPVLQGDVADVQGILNGLAEIAWAYGWRPQGLAKALAEALEGHNKYS